MGIGKRAVLRRRDWGYIPTEATQKARKLEMDRALKEKLCEYVPRTEASNKGIKPTPKTPALTLKPTSEDADCGTLE